ncbi:MAG: hypothetical protein AUJ85_10915 [Elusimicrobia bacterium CG1_02_37_114]|nr:MAG: hypothetical protein AUJ85_10915 [Elusimicrobia bacterium CG1_02_37_114]PIV52241.1 MAG: hypothetical protein COS17_10115 [Elusimicrobia bacterium CG02_land_8_20_14_3_00_37_13]PIZ13440.1 MAG: hypothetical protein COY53_04775 [Elusimicrobia bacterium CG_4_10_14_0_8_um_filter_37_32]
MNELMWLSKHKKLAEKHSGEWIAVLDNKIISSGNSAKDVLKLVKEKGIKKMPLVTKVPRKDEKMYIL